LPTVVLNVGTVCTDMCAYKRMLNIKWYPFKGYTNKLFIDKSLG